MRPVRRRTVLPADSGNGPLPVGAARRLTGQPRPVGRRLVLVTSRARHSQDSSRWRARPCESAADHAAEYTKELLKKVNKQLNSFSKIANLRQEEEPFEKTPKNTIKRYLYTKFRKHDSGK